MRKGLTLAGILVCFGLIYVRAETKDEAKKGNYQPGTVISVEMHVSESNYIGSPTDAPLQADDYSYDVRIRVNCIVYLGRYESDIDYLPSSFAPNHSVEVLLHKHILYVRVPELGREVKMGVVGHKSVKGDSCRVNG